MQKYQLIFYIKLVFLSLIYGKKIIIDPHQSIWVLDPIDVGYNGRSPMALAIKDIQLDWYKVMGIPPAVIVSDKPGINALPADFNGTALFFGQAAQSLGLPNNTHYEAHSIKVEIVNNVVMIGMLGNSHVRGQVYAAYSFSERILNVEPLWWWTDTEPQFKGNIQMDQSEIEFEFGAPTFKYRGFFTNDEDLLGGIYSDPLGQSVFSSDAWNRIIEALLRLKGNLLLPGTVAFPDESMYNLAVRRGVAVTQQHFTLLGTNTWRWPQGIPYSFDQNKEIQDFVWKTCVDAYEGRETVWTIGYRGLNDYPFWIDEPQFNTSKSRCDLISQAMNHQADIVRAKNSQQTYVTYLWQEMLELYLSGDLIIPTNTTLIFTDQLGSGTYDPRIYDKLKEGDGAYFHVQMEWPNTMSQLSEMVPPVQFFTELQIFVEKKATSYFMLNLSDLKPACFLTDIVMRYLWNSTQYLEKGPQKAQDDAIYSWSIRFYGKEFAEQASEILRLYFDVVYIDGRNSKLTDQRYGDEHLSGLIRQMLNKQKNPSDALQFTQIPLPQLNDLEQKSLKLLQDMEAVRSLGFQYYKSSFHLYIIIHKNGCKAIQSTALALQSQDMEKAVALLKDAINSIENIQFSLREAEQLKWSGLYSTDQLVDFANLSCQLRDYMRKLQQHDISNYDGQNPLCNLQNGATWRQGTGYWSPQFAYQNTSDNYPFLNKPQDQKSMQWVVRVLCDTCQNTPVGGTFNKTTKIKMFTLQNATIRYTLDGTDPNDTSPIYSEPFIINQTTKIAAKAFIDSQIKDIPLLTTRPVFTLININQNADLEMKSFLSDENQSIQN